MGIDVKLLTADQAYHDGDGSALKNTGVYAAASPSEQVRVVAEINSTKIEKDFGSYSRRIKGRILIVFGILCNAEDGPKDKQDRGSYFGHGP